MFKVMGLCGSCLRTPSYSTSSTIPPTGKLRKESVRNNENQRNRKTSKKICTVRNNENQRFVPLFYHTILLLVVSREANVAAATEGKGGKAYKKMSNDNTEGTKKMKGLKAAKKDKKKGKDGTGFNEESLKGRFSYFNTAGDVASLSVGVFDGSGNITEFGDIHANIPDGNGGREISIVSFNWGYYAVQANGRGRIYLSLGSEDCPYYDPPAEFEFVATATEGNYDITALSSFQAGVGLANQLVAPHWTKIADD